jgi:DNA-binding NarL/FixJ family response regulator
MIRLFIVEDHVIVREGLRTLLGEVPDLDLVGEAPDGPSAIAMAAAGYAVRHGLGDQA